jgi:hypothetical protein
VNTTASLDDMEEKYFFPLPGIEPQFVVYSVRSLVAIPTEIFRLSNSTLTKILKYKKFNRL